MTQQQARYRGNHQKKQVFSSQVSGSEPQEQPGGWKAQKKTDRQQEAGGGAEEAWKHGNEQLEIKAHPLISSSDLIGSLIRQINEKDFVEVKVMLIPS